VSSVCAVRGLNCVILGAGGAARAIAVELALAGAARLTIVNRTPERGALLASDVRDQTGVQASHVNWEGLYRIPDATDLVVNTTSIGLYSDTSATVPIELRALRPGTLVCDVIPNPPRTRLIQEADGRGCTVLDGLVMLVNQGVIAIKL
jgi:shikimate dehydrogenase